MIHMCVIRVCSCDPSPNVTDNHVMLVEVDVDPRSPAASPRRTPRTAMSHHVAQWWLQLWRDVSVSVTREGQELDLAADPADEHRHRWLVDVDITIVASVDPDIVSALPTTWWTKWLVRLPDVLHRLGLEVTPGQQIIAVDEATDTRRILAGVQLGGR
jgi:hypothetical protein